jgi:hypothetical protein
MVATSCTFPLWEGQAFFARPLPIDRPRSASLRIIAATGGLIGGAASTHADNVDASAEAIRLIDLALANLFQAGDFGSGARRLDQGALKITITRSHLKRKERKSNHQQDQSHGSPFNSSHCLTVGVTPL